MKKILNKILEQVGYKIIRLIQKSQNYSAKFWDAFEMQKYLTKENEQKVVIFDIGAFDGNTALKYKKLFPFSDIYSLEPFTESYELLVKNTAEYQDIISINKGVGAKEGVTEFNSNNFPQTNSLLKPHESGNKIWGDGLLDTAETIKVGLTTIDSLVKMYGIKKNDILRMDVQGAEYMVLEGAKKTLQNGLIEMIYTEIITLPTYEGQLCFDEMISLINSFGFKLFNFYNHSLTTNGELRQVDAIFIKSEETNDKFKELI